MRYIIKCRIFIKGTQIAEKHFKENYSDISPVSYHNGPRSIKQMTAYVGKDVGVNRTLIVGGSANYGNHYENQHGSSSSSQESIYYKTNLHHFSHIPK